MKAEKLILIAEDDEINYKLLVNFLRKIKYPIHWTKNGWDTYVYCIKHNVSLVLMDIKMPVMDGLQAAGLIKKKNPDTKILAQTALSFKGDRELCLNAGCDDYISKPFDNKLLVKKVEVLLEEKHLITSNL